jgi:hypothetical protein
LDGLRQGWRRTWKRWGLMIHGQQLGLFCTGKLFYPFPLLSFLSPQLLRAYLPLFLSRETSHPSQLQLRSSDFFLLNSSDDSLCLQVVAACDPAMCVNDLLVWRGEAGKPFAICHLRLLQPCSSANKKSSSKQNAYSC